MRECGTPGKKFETMNGVLLIVTFTITRIALIPFYYVKASQAFTSNDFYG